MIPAFIKKMGNRWLIIGGVFVATILLLYFALNQLTKGAVSSVTSNFRQLYVITQAASLDAQSKGHKGAFPKDFGGNFTAWSNALIPNYCTADTLRSLMSIKGKLTNTIIYNVSVNDPFNTVFIATANIDAKGLHEHPTLGAKMGIVATVTGAAILIVSTNDPSYTKLIWPNQRVWP